MGKCGLSQTRRACKKYMVQGLLPDPGRFDEDLQVLGELALPDKLIKPFRTKGLLTLHLFKVKLVCAEDSGYLFHGS